MVIFSQEWINTASYIYLLMGGIVAFIGTIVVYLDRKSKLSAVKKKKK